MSQGTDTPGLCSVSTRDNGRVVGGFGGDGDRHLPVPVVTWELAMRELDWNTIGLVKSSSPPAVQPFANPLAHPGCSEDRLPIFLVLAFLFSLDVACCTMSGMPAPASLCRSTFQIGRWSYQRPKTIGAATMLCATWLLPLPMGGLDHCCSGAPFSRNVKTSQQASRI